MVILTATHCSLCVADLTLMQDEEAAEEEEDEGEGWRSCDILWLPNSQIDKTTPNRNGLHPRSDGLQPKSDIEIRDLKRFGDRACPFQMDCVLSCLFPKFPFLHWGGGEDGEAPLGAVEEEKTIPPAAYMCLVSMAWFDMHSAWTRIALGAALCKYMTRASMFEFRMTRKSSCWLQQLTCWLSHVEPLVLSTVFTSDLLSGALDSAQSYSTLRKIVLQVLTQTEASSENGKVGIARNEPNRNAAASSVLFQTKLHCTFVCFSMVHNMFIVFFCF